MIIGHQRNRKYFERLLDNGAVGHGYLFHGPEEIGKKSFALEIAKAFFCGRKTLTLGGCGECDACRKVDSLSHPDLILVSPERPLAAEDTGQGIGIKSIQELRRILGLASWGGGKRAVIIDEAERLSRDAEAALLKTLEEPGAGIAFFLITSSPGAIAATIRSRSVPINFTALSDEAMMPLVEGVPKDRQSELLALANGRPGLLVRLVRDKNFFIEIRNREKQFQTLLGADLQKQFAFSEKESREPGRLDELFFFLAGHVRRELLENVRAQSSSANGRNSVSAKALAAFLALLLERWLALDATTANRRLLADSVFFELSLITSSAKL